jgi:hypothetical protein
MAKTVSPVIAAAAALDEALTAYDDLAREARRATMNSEKGLQRAIRLVQESTGRNEAIRQRLAELVTQMDAARQRQVESLNALLEVARQVEARAEQHQQLERRFAALADSARQANVLTLDLATRREAGAGENELLEGLQAIEAHMAAVVGEAEALARLATDLDWPEFVREAQNVRQQVLAAKNKLSLAQRSVAARAPS